MERKYRISSMDFLRSIAILSVILAHSVLAYGAPSYLAPLQFGGTGVSLFFVLSGWLLGGQLFKELDNTNTIDVKRFWYRRWMRTIPAYLAVLMLSVIQRYLTKDNVEFPWYYFVFLQNYFYPLEFFTVSWSLAVEEQFYIAVAVILLFCSKLNKISRTIVLLIFLMLPMLFRGLGLFDNKSETHVIYDGCILGVFLAHLRFEYDKVWLKALYYIRYVFIISLGAYLMFYLARYNPQWGISDPGQLLLVSVFGIWVIFANSSENVKRSFALPGSYYIATRSYSMYLLHPEVLALTKRFLSDLNFMLYFVLVLMGTLIISEFLYRLVELPFMKMRER